MNAKIVKSLFGVLLSLLFLIGVIYASVDSFFYRKIYWLGFLYAGLSIVGIVTLVIGIKTICNVLNPDKSDR